MEMKIRESCLQTGNLGYKTGLSFTNGDSWVTNGILGLLFTGQIEKTKEKVYIIIMNSLGETIDIEKVRNAYISARCWNGD